MFGTLYALARVDRDIRRWTLISAVLAPVSLIVGWLAAGLVQGDRYSPVSQTISVLAGGAASDRWIMTAGLYLLGSCQILTALGLSASRLPARLLLAVGGICGLGVAVFPQPAHGSAAAHLTFATLSVSLLAVWPVTFGWRVHPSHLLLSRRGALLTTAVFLGLLTWLFVAAHGGGALGIAERVDTAITNSWPLVIVIAIRSSSAQGNYDHERPTGLRRRADAFS